MIYVILSILESPSQRLDVVCKDKSNFLSLLSAAIIKLLGSLFITHIAVTLLKSLCSIISY